MKRQKTITWLIPAFIGVFLLCVSCITDPEVSVEYYRQQDKDPNLIGRWELFFPDNMIKGNDSFYARTITFSSRGFLYREFLEVRDDGFLEVGQYKEVFYTKNGYLHYMIVGDGFKSGNVPLVYKYRIEDNNILILMDKNDVIEMKYRRVHIKRPNL